MSRVLPWLIMACALASFRWWWLGLVVWGPILWWLRPGSGWWVLERVYRDLPQATRFPSAAVRRIIIRRW